jgi:hypothetical protein
MTSELLDDYEEGTFTPTISSGYTSPTYSEQAGWYIKIGNVVHFKLRIVVSGGTRAAAAVVFSGLPFTSNASTSLGTSGAYFGYADAFANTTLIPFVYKPNNTSTLQLFTHDVSPAGFAGTSLDRATPAFVIVGSYRV